VIRSPAVLLAIGTVIACAGAAPPPAGAPAPVPASATIAAPVAPADAAAARREPILPPVEALMRGLMPLRATGVPEFRNLRPTADGRGVVIAILDSGIDPGTLGLITTSRGQPKILDLRDFSGEGRVPLVPVAPEQDGTVSIAGRRLAGARRAGRIAVGSAWYGGVFRELPLGPAPAADVNGNGTNTDEFPVVVVRASDGWVAFLDTNRDGSLEDEMPLHDFRQGRETVAPGTRPITLAANFADSAGVPRLDLYFDTSGHGTFVAGVAAGHNMFNVAGFHGVAPGASLLGLKIANDARGGISVSGSIARALEYAARFAAERRLPLVANLSFGVGNEREGRATIDSLIDAFLARHPEVVLSISAGNDGPGLSTIGFPATSARALTVGSTFPGVFARRDGEGVPERVAAWSARGGETAKPDLLAPGMAFSTVPAWQTGKEVQAGTSLSAPHVAGLVACLVSALEQEGRRFDAAQLIQALRVSATRLPGGTALDQGGGVPRLAAAYRWLVAGHQGSTYVVRARSGWSAAFRRDGLAGPADTSEVFTVRHAAGQRAARFALRSDAPWLVASDTVVAAPGATDIRVTYRAHQLRAAGEYVGTVTAHNPADTLAGPLFTLVNAVIVPHDLLVRPLVESRRRIGSGRVQRYFLRVPAGGATLHVTVTLPDSANETAVVNLFEPGGQPFRDQAAGWALDEEQGTARFVVRGEDVVPGVYELDVVPSPLGPPDGATVAVRGEIAAVTIASGPAGLEIANPGTGPAAVRVAQHFVGVARTVQLRGRGEPVESLTVDVPTWAQRGTVDVAVAPDLWAEFTDLGVTVFDTAGHQVAREPQNYAVGRQELTLEDTAAGPVVVELFPGWADPGAARPWDVTVTVRFFVDEPMPLGDAVQLRIQPAGRVPIAPALVTSPLVPAGFAALIEVTGESDDGRGPAARRLEGAP
jgi:subtilisin family serine protease